MNSRTKKSSFDTSGISSDQKTSSTINGGSTLSNYSEGTHATTWGASIYPEPVTGDINYAVVGKQVTLEFPEVSGTISVTGFCEATTVLPLELRPAQDLRFIVSIIDSGFALSGSVIIGSDGSISFAKNPGGSAFDNTPSGFQSQTLTYLV